jgi:hypothetical protein
MPRRGPRVQTTPGPVSGKQLQAMRTACGISLRHLVKEMGVNYGVVYHVERNVEQAPVLLSLHYLSTIKSLLSQATADCSRLEDLVRSDLPDYVLKDVSEDPEENSAC